MQIDPNVRKPVYCVLCYMDTGKKVLMHVIQVMINQKGLIWKCPVCGREKAETDNDAVKYFLDRKKIFSDIKFIGN